MNKQKKKQITVKTIFIFKEKRKKGDNLIYILNAYSKTKQKTLDTNNWKLKIEQKTTTATIKK